MLTPVETLKESSDFLNLIFDNINSAIFIVDQDIKIREFNDSFKALFGKIDKYDVIGRLCGNSIGCKFQVEEEVDCGKTSHCGVCKLRRSIVKAFARREDTHKKTLKREFYINERKINKHMLFTVKNIVFEGEEMALLIFEDVTLIEEQKEKIRDRNRLIESQNKKLIEDLELARKVQQNLIPSKLPQNRNIDFFSVYKPLEQVGGDIYDIIEIDNESVGIFISDISGHGVPAAMITIMIKSFMEASKALLTKPDKLMEYINDKLISLSKNMYLTVFYGIYNTKTMDFTYVRCGHPYPILIREGELIEIEESSGLMLGVFEKIDVEIHKISLREDDKLLFYTDGLVESLDIKGNLYENRFMHMVHSSSDLDIRNIVNGVYEDLSYFVSNGKQKDDICLIGMQVK